MIKISDKYYFREARLTQVVEEGRQLAEAYPNLPSDVLAELQKEADRLFCTKPTKKKSKKKLNHD